jgi:23S rRNA (uracil1939-C5)-methyltransferase
MDKPGKNEIIELKIEDIGFEGNGIGKTSGNFAVFVPNTVPGDLVSAQIIKVKKNLAEAKLVKIISQSLFRTIPECSYFGTCNGCRMQNIEYSKQLMIKRQSVINAFERIGGFKNITIPEVTGSDEIFYYRNKLEFSFSSNRWLTEADMNSGEADKSFALGFHKPGFIDKIIDIHKCHLQSEISNNILNLTRSYFKEKNISIYSTKTHEGFLRFLVIRQSANTNDLMVNLITSGENTKLIKGYADALLKEIPEKKYSLTIIHSISTKKAQVAQAETINVLHGKGYIEEKLGDINFKITPFSFFQTNTRQCEKLFKLMTEIADFSKDDKVIDLYCGCGAISLYISDKVNSVHGVEMSEDSINYAIENAELNNVTNCSFLASDVKEYLQSILPPNEGNYEFDTVILDPPRSGIHPKAAEYLLQLEPAKIIYVSCNPTTQARDIKLLAEKYEIRKVQPVDMFPHTFHIENIVRLDLYSRQNINKNE